MVTTRHNSSYRKIVSSTAIFGSAQAFGVVINLIRGKIVAMILHSAGMGIMTLFNNAANTIQQFAILGMNISAVRNISQANDNKSDIILAKTIRIVRYLFAFASIFGLVLTLIASPLISQTSFGDFSYLPFFILLSLAVLLNILSTGEITIMQGLRRYKQLAFCSIIPPLCGLMLSVPIYYYWGTQGIVPAMIASGAVYYFVIRLHSYHSPRQDKGKGMKLKEIWSQGHEIIQLGFVLMIGNMVGAITTYCIMASISNMGSVSDVGFYQAANAISIQYVSMIFTAMATDYYPRLSSTLKTDTAEAYLLVNQQTEVVLLTITPLVMLMMLTAPPLIDLLLTHEFQAIRHLIYCFALANIFKALCFPMDYIGYAKGDKTFILWVETTWNNAKTFIVIVGSYYFFGLDGIGYGVLASAILDATVSIVFTHIRYRFTLSGQAVRLLAIMFLLALACFIGAFTENTWVSYTIMSTTTTACIIYSLVQLNRRINLLAIIKRFKRKR